MHLSLHRERALWAEVGDRSRRCMNHRHAARHPRTSQRLMIRVCALQALALWPAPAAGEIAFFREHHPGFEKTPDDLATLASRSESNANQCQLRGRTRQQQ